MDKLFYGNTILQWIIALSIFIGSLIVSKIIYWVSTKVLKKQAEKTNTEVDDILIDKLDEPLKYLAIIAGFYFSTAYLVIESKTLESILFGIAKFAMIIDMTWLISRVLDAGIVGLHEKYGNKEDASAFYTHFFPIIRKAVRTLLWSMGIIIGLDNVGIDVTAMIAGLGIGGLALALAAQDLIKNTFGGIMVFLDKPFQVGERIKVNGFDGTVEEVGLRSTRLRTLDGRLVTIPNSKFSDNTIENVSSEPNRKVVVNIGVSCDSDTSLAMDILKEIIEEDPRIEENYSVGFNSFGDYTLGLILVYRIKKGEDILGTQTDVNTSINCDFEEAGIKMPFPTQKVLMEKLD